MHDLLNSPTIGAIRCIELLRDKPATAARSFVGASAIASIAWRMSASDGVVSSLNEPIVTEIHINHHVGAKHIACRSNRPAR